jgi:hypothetical protein
MGSVDERKTLSPTQGKATPLCYYASKLTGRSTSVVLKGLQVHVDSLYSEMDRSPVSVLFKSDVTLDRSSKDCTYIILLDKGDPLEEHGLINPSQARAGEVITWDISWGSDDQFDVPYFTVLGQAKERVVFGGLLATSSIPEDEARVIARITLSKPTNWRDTVLAAASWPNPRGHTIRTQLFLIPKEEADNLDMLRSSPEALKAVAVEVYEQVNGLDTPMTNRYASMTKLGVPVAGTNSDISRTL